jgi:rhamnosyltransferase
MEIDTKLKLSVLIPTLNAGPQWPALLKSIDGQSVVIDRKIIIDSGSADDTVKLAREHGFEVVNIQKSEFNHGRVRQQLADMAGTDICIFLTQDAILANQDSLKNLTAAFTDEKTGLAYGRQLPHKNAKPLEIHARLFNYPPISGIRSFQDKESLGFKVFFCSNSFAAYRASALRKAGGFPSESIMGEDALVSARMLLDNYHIAYVAEATVYHSHSYSFMEELRRYFDTRVFHEQNPWLIENYGKPTGEGLRFIRSEVSYAIKNDLKSFPKVFSSVFGKWTGYTLGGFYKKMPVALLKRVSMHHGYWK